MRRLFLIPLLCSCSRAVPAPTPDPAPFEPSRFVNLSLECASKEYPNKPDRTLSADTDLLPPRMTNPAFFGCFDWHSSVHGHWALVRVLNAYPDLLEADAIKRVLSNHLTRERIGQEVVFFSAESNAIVERPYGWGWLLRLSAELHASKLPEARAWEQAVRPLAALLATRLLEYLAKLSVPVRAGTHANTAFSLVHALDYARALGDAPLASGIEQAAKRFYAADTVCPVRYEPSGEDFISPCLAEADLMRRALTPAEFRPWLDAFLPSFGEFAKPAEAKDRHDPRIGHLIGLSLQRAWAMDGIASSLGQNDPRTGELRRLSVVHRNDAFKQMFDSGYGGSHWLASFAIYLATAQPK
jgi:hypothetical protein